LRKEPTNPEERSDAKLPDRQKQNAIHEPQLAPKEIARNTQSPDEQVLNSGFNFYETWEGVESTCPSCGWRVSLSRSHTIRKNDSIEFLCGNCRETLTGVWLPTQAEGPSGDSLSVMTFECLEAREKGFQRECDLKIWMEEGFCAPKIEDSMLGLDWSLFATRGFPEHSEDTSFRNPPEFVSYALSTLDAYSTAVLASHIERASLGFLHFSCRLKQREVDSQLQLEFVTTPERGKILPGTAMLELLSAFPDLLRAKGIQEDAVYYLQGEGCPMLLAYPGRMLVKVSPFLRDRPLDLWPQATVSITPTDELVIRAKAVVEFVQNIAPMTGAPN
jgi:predicted RNA-binding Zn-ribbon protein involved in translation (DUF1610 family)